jgi:hypothetical protein
MVDGIATEVSLSLAEEIISGSIRTRGGFMPQVGGLELGRKELE